VIMTKDASVRSVQLIIALIAIGGLLSIPFITAPADAQRIHFGVIFLSSMSPQSAKIIVSKTQEGSATYWTTVTVSKPPAVGKVYADLYATSSEGYPVSVEPQHIVFIYPNSVNVRVTIIIPTQAAPLDQGHISVVGRVSFPGGSYEQKVTATFSILRYYDLNVMVGPVVAKGGMRTINVTVRNDGNGNDSYSVIAKDPTGILNITQDKTRTRMLGPDQTDTIQIVERCPLEVLEHAYQKEGWNISIQTNSTAHLKVVSPSDQRIVQNMTVQFRSGPNINYRVTNAAFTLIGMLFLVVALKIIRPNQR